MPTRGSQAGERVAAITGGCGAIGAALEGRLRAAGWTVVALDLPHTELRTQPTQDTTAPQVGGSASGSGEESDDEAARERWVALDVTDPESVVAAFAEVEASFGRLDLLVIAAGVTALGTFEDTPDATFRRLMDINFHGAVACLRSALPALRRSRGHVVVLSSVAGFAPVLGRPAYVASKHALTGTFAALRPELAQDGIGLTLVHPTFVANELADANAGPDRAVGATTAQRTTTGALVTPEQVAKQILTAVAGDRRWVMPGRTAWLAYHIHRLVPRLYEWLMARRLR